jgi:long-subunit fatty acid transport protein
MKYKRSLLVLILFLFGYSSTAQAQGFNAVGLGMGNAFGAVARGVDAFTWNPANLALPYENRMELNLIGFNVNAANSTLSIDDYKRYFTESGHGGHWDEHEIDELLELIPEDGLDASGDAHANVLGILFGRYGLSIQGIGKSLGVIPKSMLELALKGNQEQFKEFGFSDFDGDAFTAAKLSLSLSHPFKFKKFFEEFGIGLNVNYYMGIAMAEITRAEGSMVTTDDAIVSSMDVISRTGQGGSGFGFDFGAAGKIKKDWTVSMVLKNMFAGLTWTQNLEENRTTFVVDSITIDNFGELDSLVSTTTYEIEEFTTRLPLVFHFGVAYDVRENLKVALDLEQAFEDKLGYSDKAQIALGVEYKPTRTVPLRMGMSIGGKYKYLFGIGMGIHVGFVNLDLAYAMKS